MTFCAVLWAFPNGMATGIMHKETHIQSGINDGSTIVPFFSSSSSFTLFVLLSIQFHLFFFLPFLLLICRLTFYDRCFIAFQLIALHLICAAQEMYMLGVLYTLGALAYFYGISHCFAYTFIHFIPFTVGFVLWIHSFGFSINRNGNE